MPEPLVDSADSLSAGAEAGRPSEVQTVVRAGISSIAATLTDALVYQLLLFAAPALYGTVAFCGAVAGAAVNFSLNRGWAFRRRAQGISGQMLRYALTSLVIFLALRALLWLFVERLGMPARLAWLPAKLLSWVCVSYPVQRYWVFGTGARAS